MEGGREREREMEKHTERWTAAEREMEREKGSQRWRDTERDRVAERELERERHTERWREAERERRKQSRERGRMRWTRFTVRMLCCPQPRDSTNSGFDTLLRFYTPEVSSPSNKHGS